MLLPGASGAGKSTLTRACVGDGAHYLSDELAAVRRADGLVVPYPKPLGIGRDLVVASALRPHSLAAPCASAGIVFPRYDPGAATTVTELDPAWTLLGLCAHATNLAAVGADALAWLVGLATGCPAWQVDHADARDVVPIVRRAARGAAPVVPATPIPAVTSSTTAFVLGDGLAVLDHRSGKVHVLDPSTATVWRHEADGRAAQTGGSSAQLDPGARTRTVAQLREIGLLPVC